MYSLEYYGVIAGREYEWSQLMELARTQGSDLLMGIVSRWEITEVTALGR
jgi:hypothetical protein